MTNNEYLHFKKVLWGSVAAVIVTAFATAVAFYFSTIHNIQTLNKTAEKHEYLIDDKIGRREFDRFRYDYDIHCNNIDRKFESIDNKLDRLIDFQLNKSHPFDFQKQNN
jgi:hypothetical protein